MEEVLPHIPDWLIGKRCNECLSVQYYTGVSEFRDGQPAIVEIKEQHQRYCTRSARTGKLLRFEYKYKGK